MELPWREEVASRAYLSSRLPTPAARRGVARLYPPVGMTKTSCARLLFVSARVASSRSLNSHQLLAQRIGGLQRLMDSLREILKVRVKGAHQDPCMPWVLAV
jgi:hypothetical protein